ncbi:MAG: TRAFs-binding domain-containing protein, partial [Pseudomonadota bacterium]
PAIGLHDLRACVALWQGREGNPESAEPAWHLTLARRGLALGEPLFAYEVCAEAAERWIEHGDLRKVLALALARSGATGSALDIAYSLFKAGHRDGEMFGLLGRIHKDLWQQRNDAQELAKAIRYYEDGLRWEPKNYFNGINASTLTLCAGRTKRAHALAHAVLDICFDELATTPATAKLFGSLLPWSTPGTSKSTATRNDKTCQDYWLLATVGEAALVLAIMPLAEAAYEAARNSPDAGVGSLATSRRNAKLILAGHKGGLELLARMLPQPRIAIFCGHMVDIGRAKPRFPARALARVLAAIGAWIDTNAINIGYAPAASGGDLLFHDALAARCVERHVVLPHSREPFCQHSVAPAGRHWVRQYEQLLDTATSVTAVADEVSDAESYRYANRMIVGMARSRARMIDGEVIGLALWDGRRGKSGGTGSAVAGWLAAGVPITVIDPLTGETRPLAKDRESRPEKRPAPQFGRRETVALLFADAVGFSKLTERQLPRFIRYFLHPIGRLSAARNGRPLTVNTWGDGLYMTFTSAAEAGRFALKLRDIGSRNDWEKVGLPAHINIRIGLHAGPAIRMIDPVTKQLNFMGSNVSRAARIEPVTPPGQVYCSEPFAALAEAELVSTFVCEYVGNTVMAKKYGSFPTYRVRPVM